MSKIKQAIHDIHFFDELAERDVWINQIHPLSKLLVTIIYLILVMSFDSYNLSGLAGMSIYLVIMIFLFELPVIPVLKRLRFVLMAVVILAAVNPILDRQIVTQIGEVEISAGMISMCALILKAIFAIFATFILIETTSIENICYAMRKIHIPKIMVTVIMLIYRYIILMLQETERMSQAYSLRAPGQKGVHHKLWGSFVGHLLLRSMSRAERVYESMMLRGFNGEFYLKGNFLSGKISLIYACVWCALLIFLRFIPLFEIVGMMF